MAWGKYKRIYVQFNSVMADLSIEQSDVINTVVEQVRERIEAFGKNPTQVHIFEPDVQEELREEHGTTSDFVAYALIVHEDPLTRSELGELEDDTTFDRDIVCVQTERTHSRSQDTQDTTIEITL